MHSFERILSTGAKLLLAKTTESRHQMFTFKEYGVADVIIQMFTHTSEEQHVWVEGETLPQRYAHVREKNS